MASDWSDSPGGGVFYFTILLGDIGNLNFPIATVGAAPSTPPSTLLLQASGSVIEGQNGQQQSFDHNQAEPGAIYQDVQIINSVNLLFPCFFERLNTDKLIFHLEPGAIYQDVWLFLRTS